MWCKALLLCRNCVAPLTLLSVCVWLMCGECAGSGAFTAAPYCLSRCAQVPVLWTVVWCCLRLVGSLPACLQLVMLATTTPFPPVKLVTCVLARCCCMSDVAQLLQQIERECSEVQRCAQACARARESGRLSRPAVCRKQGVGCLNSSAATHVPLWCALGQATVSLTATHCTSRGKGPWL